MTATAAILPAILSLAMACSAAAPRPPACPPGAPPVATATEPAIPPEDDALRRWKAIAATADKAPPPGASAASLVPELLAYLASPDPVRRDGIAFEVLARWLDAKTLADAEVRELARRLLEDLAGPLDAPDGVLRRSFSALVLAEVVRRDRKAPLLSDDERRAILRAAVAYAARETDLRGHTGAKGWAHAAAHTADLLARLAGLPAFTDADRALILDAVASFVVRRHGQILAYGEDGRLATSVVAAARAGLPEQALDAWLAALKAPLVERGSAAFDAGLFAAQRNVRNLLFTLYVHGATAASPSPGERVLFEKVRALLAG
jgi:hypothetical protein